MTTPLRPVVALTLGDPAGIGPELVARLLSRPDVPRRANIVLVGDPWLWEQGQRVAGVRVGTRPVEDFAEVRARPDADVPAFLPMNTVDPVDVIVGKARAAGGKSVLQVLDRCMTAAMDGQIDAICFAPLNKHAMKLGGLRHEDELHHFAEYLGVTTYFCEFNTMGSLWTSRISSHIPIKDVPRYIDKDRIKDATRLIHRSLLANGVQAPRVAVAALNPHGGDGGTCGREEVEIIEPAVRELVAEGLPIEGPYPADTIFLKARDGLVDAVVTMYHDQGQIAIKLLGFSKGVTVQGGLPIPITTPAHGTAYDIAGQGRADDNAIANAYAIACRMGLAQRQAAIR
ncbi:4-hydroxythreonine-4-phosphate dehydrogenase PdxA [Pigmentiphaga sp. GD03639]|uniref:4-hydroxythreonine-4-phosphate dehydrogenase PdxA n=1 Tax=Pigmentiphaga sp. GD03639 TaxID=2975354 RepID=UPI002446A8BF|nr:4-hydroxythreonine-4-phosphate dehydrogenase PdxA [Pigmentiphaga sp. GD03639]MDH2240056.1 4-hydroxythreonine-4-phosphate dehydrogenase PdxA [Pigmentiphaga sp. GD03639]